MSESRMSTPGADRARGPLRHRAPRRREQDHGPRRVAAAARAARRQMVPAVGRTWFGIVPAMRNHRQVGRGRARAAPSPIVPLGRTNPNVRVLRRVHRPRACAVTCRWRSHPNRNPMAPIGVPALDPRNWYGSPPPTDAGAGGEQPCHRPGPSTSRRPSTMRAGSGSWRMSRVGPRTGSCRDALTVLVNLEHRGASGSEANTGDGAGLLVAIPHRFLGAVAAEAGISAPGERLRRRDGLPAARRAEPRGRARALRARRSRRRASSSSAGATSPRTRPASAAPPRPASRSSPRRSSPAPPASPATEDGDLAFDRRLYVARRLVGEGRRPERAPGPRRLLRPLDVLPDDRLQGDAQRPPAADLLPGRHRRAARERHRPRPLPVLDQHLPVVGPRAPVPLHQPQRRDQHAARERELDVRPPVDVHVVGVRRGPGEGPAGGRRRRVGHGDLRQRARAAPPLGPEPRPRDDDDGPRAVEPGRDDVARAARVLRVPLVPHGAVGRPGVAGVHRRRPRRRDARPQRPPPRPLLGHARRAGRHGLGVGRARHPARATSSRRAASSPGRMFLVDTAQGRIVPRRRAQGARSTRRAALRAVGARVARRRSTTCPKPDDGHRARPRDRPPPPGGLRLHHRGRPADHRRHGDDAAPTRSARWATTPRSPSCRERPQLLYSYFKQLFAQVTNPPVDAIREEIIMATDRSIGPEANLLEPGPDAAHQVALPSPVISQRGARDDPGARRRARQPRLPDDHAADPVQGRRERRRASGGRSRTSGAQASEAIAEGYNQVILSDRGHNEIDAPDPGAPRRVSAVHHHLVRDGTRGRVGLVLESGEPREAHHFCLLIGYGASAINPYLAFETIDDQVRLGVHPGPRRGRPSSATARPRPRA